MGEGVSRAQQRCGAYTFSAKKKKRNRKLKSEKEEKEKFENEKFFIK